MFYNCSDTFLSFFFFFFLFSFLSDAMKTDRSILKFSFAIGIVGDAGVRGSAQQPRLYVGMILILIFAEVLGKFGELSIPFILMFTCLRLNDLFSCRSVWFDRGSPYELPGLNRRSVLGGSRSSLSGMPRDLE